MTEIYLAGGRQRADIDPEKKAEWQHYALGLIVALDLESGTGRQVASWTSPPDARPDVEPSFVFKAGTLDRAAGRYYACTQTEVLVFEFPSFTQVGYISLPAFNDLHHVVPTGTGTLMVTSTGLDTVLELTPEGRVVREWSVDGGEPFVRFKRDVDYRKVATTKPHVCHPNFAFQLNGEWWATRCNKRDAVSLTAAGTISLGTVGVHDGHVVDGTVYFTSVDGHVIEVDAAARAVRNTHDLTRSLKGMPAGWCRGLEVLGDGMFLVGFSRTRPTKWKESMKWLKRELGGSGHGLSPTHLTGYDAARGRIAWELNVEPFGMNAIFSIHAPDPAAVRAFLKGR